MMLKHRIKILQVGAHTKHTTTDVEVTLDEGWSIITINEDNQCSYYHMKKIELINPQITSQIKTPEGSNGNGAANDPPAPMKVISITKSYKPPKIENENIVRSKRIMDFLENYQGSILRILAEDPPISLTQVGHELNQSRYDVENAVRIMQHDGLVYRERMKNSKISKLSGRRSKFQWVVHRSALI